MISLNLNPHVHRVLFLCQWPSSACAVAPLFYYLPYWGLMSFALWVVTALRIGLLLLRLVKPSTMLLCLACVAPSSSQWDCSIASCLLLLPWPTNTAPCLTLLLQRFIVLVCMHWLWHLDVELVEIAKTVCTSHCLPNETTSLFIFYL